MRRWSCSCRDRSGHSSSASRSACASVAIASSRSISISATHGSRADPAPSCFAIRQEQWQIWFRTFLAGHRPKCVVLFGDQRTYHHHAIAACKEFDVDVWCIEEGYIRPDYVTFERGGNSAASALATSWDDGKARDLKPPTPIMGNGFRAMAKATVPYYVVNTLLRRYVDNYTHHRVRPLLTEGFFWLRNAYRKWRRRIEERLCVARTAGASQQQVLCRQRFRFTTISASRPMAVDGRTNN
jgi:capsule polysaccharide modification protein KpsS